MTDTQIENNNPIEVLKQELQDATNAIRNHAKAIQDTIDSLESRVSTLEWNANH